MEVTSPTKPHSTIAQLSTNQAPLNFCSTQPRPCPTLLFLNSAQTKLHSTIAKLRPNQAPLCFCSTHPKPRLTQPLHPVPHSPNLSNQSPTHPTSHFHTTFSHIFFTQHFFTCQAYYPNQIKELVRVYCVLLFRNVFYIDFNCQLLSHMPW